MNASNEQLLNTVLGLPVEVRLEFVEAIAASLPPDDRASFHEAWGEVLRRRLAELESGQVDSVPWSEVRRIAREKLGEAN